MSIARRRAGATEDSQQPVGGVTHHSFLPTSQGAKPTRLTPARARRRIARRVRRLAGASPEPDPVRRRHVFLLVDRVADVRDHVSELHASMYFLRCRLQDTADSPDDAPS